MCSQTPISGWQPVFPFGFSAVKDTLGTPWIGPWGILCAWFVLFVVSDIPKLLLWLCLGVQWIPECSLQEVTSIQFYWKLTCLTRTLLRWIEDSNQSVFQAALRSQQSSFHKGKILLLPVGTNFQVDPWKVSLQFWSTQKRHLGHTDPFCEETGDSILHVVSGILVIAPVRPKCTVRWVLS